MLTPESRLADFPVLGEMTYLNTAAESLPPPAVREALSTYLDHTAMGMRGRDFHFAELDACRRRAAGLLGRQPHEVAFCSCSSEAYNLLASALDLQAGDEAVITDLDFPSGATPWLAASRRPEVRLWRQVDGELDLRDLAPLLNGNTRLVQVSLVSFLNGHRIPWAPFRDLVRRLAPGAVLSVDVTQAFGRVELDCLDADILISSTHKWLLGIHGGCVVSIPEASADRLTTRAGGWYHLANAFDEDRFTRAGVKPGAAGFAVGMPNFPAIYALNAGMTYLERVGIGEIARHADPIVSRLHDGLRDLGIPPLSPSRPGNASGIVAFRHDRDEEIHAALLAEQVHVMRQAGRLRIAVHGYNQVEDIDRLLAVLGKVLS